MRIKLPSTFNTRIFLPLTFGLLFMVAGFVVVQLLSFREIKQQIESDRLILANVAAERVDTTLQDMSEYFRLMVNESRLDPADFTEKNQLALETIYANFDGMVDFIILTDARGIVTGNYPLLEEGIGRDLADDEYVRRILDGEDCVFTNLYPTPLDITPCAWIKMSVTNPQGVLIGVIFARLDLDHARIADLMQPVGLGDTGFGELVDENGLVLASGRSGRTLQAVDCEGLFWRLVREGDQYSGEYPACTEGMPDEIIAFSPLEQASWGVVIRQSKDEALAYSRSIRDRSMVVAVVAAGVAGVLMLLVDRGFMRPMKALSTACEEISLGDLDHPLPVTEYKEIDDCVTCFEILRQRLKASVEEIEQMNLELENKVALRTEELQQAEQTVKQLLHRIVAAQEEERQRIARELHDETSQSLTALTVMLNTAVLTPADTPDEVKARLAPIQEATTSILDEINRIILDLRPGILDDLGLVQAIDWYAKMRMREANIEVETWVLGKERRPSPEVEVMVFRIVQEAINNIVKHAGATRASVSVNYREDAAVVTVEDDGCGFCPLDCTAQGATAKHYGLLGMKERAALIQSELEVASEPGQGTSIKLTIPYGGSNHHV